MMLANTNTFLKRSKSKSKLFHKSTPSQIASSHNTNEDSVADSQPAAPSQPPRQSLSRRASIVMRNAANDFHLDDEDFPTTLSDETTGGEVVAAYPDMNGSEMRAVGDPARLGFSVEENEKIVQVLCDFESGFSLMLDRIKQNMSSCKEVAMFLKKRASVEEEYGRSMMKLSQNILQSKSDDGKRGTYAEAWKHTMCLHEHVGEIRLKFASRIADIAEEVSTLHKNTERSRKQLKESGYKHWRVVHESENALEKAKSKYESCSEDWERAILNREQVIEGGSTMMMPQNSKGGLAKSISNLHLWKTATSSTNPAKVQKLEDDARTRAALANESYKQQLAVTNNLRTQYFQTHLPRLIRQLVETNEECDHTLKTHLVTYANELEQSITQEALTVRPMEPVKIDLLQAVEKINNSTDFEQYMVSCFANANQQLQKSEYQYSPYSMSPEALNLAHPKPVFGVDLTVVTEREAAPVPVVVVKCIQAVERYGLRTQGLYRVSAAHHNVQRLRSLLDKDVEKVNLDEWNEEINVVASALKLYFRELPDSLFPKSMYHAFIDAARHDAENTRLMHIHELVNQLSDAHYNTLGALVGHLFNVQQLEGENRMGIQNLAIVWAPTLMDSPGEVDPMELRLQSKVVETVLANYTRIFDVESF
ncbi:hypothetical protein HDU78_002991 [Chytriomyces hyalinus]|nr:hypothetical protein HDU78_002991 [Chytriomyces hyalinus]